MAPMNLHRPTSRQAFSHFIAARLGAVSVFRWHPLIRLFTIAPNDHPADHMSREPRQSAIIELGDGLADGIRLESASRLPKLWLGTSTMT